MIRSIPSLILLLAAPLLQAGTCVIHLHGGSMAQQHVLLYRYDDLLTRRTTLMVRGRLDAQGHAELTVEIDARTRAQLRVGDAVSDLYLVADTHYELEISIAPGQARSLGATARLDVVFNGMDPMDINALTSDLNERIDAFVAEDLATDERTGMEAADAARASGGTTTINTGKPPTLYVSPAGMQQRVDSFERKLRRFYAEVEDPFFQHELDYAMAGLHLGPQASQRVAWERWIKGRTIRYDSPEQLRYLHTFFDKHLLMHPFRSNEKDLLRLIRTAQRDSLDRLVARHEFLKDDTRLRELVWLDNLYAEYFGKTFDRTGILALLRRVEGASAFPEHRTIAANMVWDLTAMRPGSTFPTMRLSDPAGELVEVNGLLEGPVCIAVTAAWCDLCAAEIEALKKLDAEYGKLVQFVVVSVDSMQADFRRMARTHTSSSWHWLQAGADPVFMDELRLRGIPAFFLLNGRELSHAPAPLPSAGMAEILHRLKAEADQRNAIRFGSDAPAPTRPER